jgi:DNA processing protein
VDSIVFFPNAIDTISEAVAYETLWARRGATVKRIADLFAGRQVLPSEVLSELNEDGIDELRRSVERDVISRLDGVGISVASTIQYPPGLRSSKYPVELFYYRGNLDLLSVGLVSVVGSREASNESMALTRDLVWDLIEDNWHVVSGLARGIDTAALETSRKRNTPSVAVIGTPVDHYYPPENRDLQEHIAANGLLISHVPFYRYDHEPFRSHRTHFPWRNDTMAAISSATVIMEAGDTSGTLTQARAALQQGRRLFIHETCLRRAGLSWPKTYIERGAVVFKTAAELISLLYQNPERPELDEMAQA